MCENERIGFRWGGGHAGGAHLIRQCKRQYVNPEFTMEVYDHEEPGLIKLKQMMFDLH